MKSEVSASQAFVVYWVGRMLALKAERVDDASGLNPFGTFREVREGEGPVTWQKGGWVPYMPQ